MNAPDGVGGGSGGRRAGRLNNRFHQDHRIARDFRYIALVKVLESVIEALFGSRGNKDWLWKRRRELRRFNEDVAGGTDAQPLAVQKPKGMSD